MLTQISEFIATTTEPLILLTLAIIISIILYSKNNSKAILLASTSLITAIVIKILKTTIQAPRPISNLIQETGYSFPSGHTTFAVIFFGLLVYIFTKTKNQKIIASVIATLTVTTIALSRLILKVHYPIDIIGGLIIGTSILIISILAHKKLTS
ncbi:phosphatase PAP2 family protein [archaeon]|jgi:undecaprenyl-diphosphatase|nr:phosphatase PAP2 family protein [archaeon]MBT7128528.1 phosphatase PAP2 family protein [archaeon]